MTAAKQLTLTDPCLLTIDIRFDAAQSRTDIAKTLVAHLISSIVDLPATLDMLDAAIRSDPVFAAAVEHVAEAKINQPGVQDLVGRVNKARSDTDALALIGSESEDHRHAQAQPKLGPTARSRLQGALTVIAALDPAAITAATPNRDVAQTVRKQILAAADVLARTEKALKAR